MANEPETRWLFGYTSETRDNKTIYVPNKCGHIFDCGASDFTNNQTVCPVCGTSYTKSEGKQWSRVRP